MPPTQNKNTSMLVIVMALVLVGVVGYLFYNSKKVPEPFTSIITDTEKSAIISSLNDNASGTTLSDQEKKQILKDLSAGESKNPPLTDREKQAILNSY
jgi:uncharacterized membrane protein